MEHMFTRYEWLLGKDTVADLKTKSVAVFGCGGVGSFAIETLVRSGIGRIVIIDGDQVTPSNMNRQLIAQPDTVGKRKAELGKARALMLRPDMIVEGCDLVYTKEKYPDFIENMKVDFVIDAIDMVTAKLDIIMECQRLGIPCISAMGTGNKVHPELLTFADIHKTHMCPLAKVMRRELRARHVKKQMVLFSKEHPRTPDRGDDTSRSPGTCAFVPSVAGIMLAGYVVRYLAGIE